MEPTPNAKDDELIRILAEIEQHPDFASSDVATGSDATGTRFIHVTVHHKDASSGVVVHSYDEWRTLEGKHSRSGYDEKLIGLHARQVKGYAMLSPQCPHLFGPVSDDPGFDACVKCHGLATHKWVLRWLQEMERRG